MRFNEFQKIPKPNNQNSNAYLQYIASLNGMLLDEGINNDNVAKPGELIENIQRCLPGTEELLTTLPEIGNVFNFLCIQQAYEVIWALLESEKITKEMFRFSKPDHNPLYWITRHQQFSLFRTFISSELLSASNITRDILNTLRARQQSEVLEAAEEYGLIQVRNSYQKISAAMNNTPAHPRHIPVHQDPQLNLPVLTTQPLAEVTNRIPLKKEPPKPGIRSRSPVLGDEWAATCLETPPP
ncbi:MAG: hypothetical protein Q8R79_09205 [Legionellaceae bacterium]|nr:hypothetical protein [Legionellaceae bacterium]